MRPPRLKSPAFIGREEKTPSGARFLDNRRFEGPIQNHTLLNHDAIGWLNQFAGVVLNDRQRLALVYLRQHGTITNSDYRRLSRVDANAAGHELRGLVEARLAEQIGFGRWTSYKLKVPLQEPTGPTGPTEQESILKYVREHGSISNAECRDLLGVDRQRAKYLLGRMVTGRRLTQEGKRRWTRFKLP